MSKNILIINGHPLHDSFCSALGKAYCKGAESRGSSCQTIVLSDLEFDPLLRHAYRKEQPLEPDLKKAQELIRWSDHLIIVYPVWWGTMPALLKGFIDRIFLPHFAFKYRKFFPLPVKLLRGRSASLLITLDSPPIIYSLIFKKPGIQSLKKSVLEFSGFRPVRVKMFGPVRNSSNARREKWLKKARNLGRSHFI